MEKQNKFVVVNPQTLEEQFTICWDKFIQDIRNNGNGIDIKRKRKPNHLEWDETKGRFQNMNYNGRGKQYISFDTVKDVYLGKYPIKIGSGSNDVKYRTSLGIIEVLKEKYNLDTSHIKGQLYHSTGTVLPNSSAAKSEFSKNIILYGPPGTGKTYNTARYAVAICDGRTLKDVETDNYDNVMKRYKELVSQGRAVFTTFHQSYGYEEFIEGIKPDINNNGDVIYKVQDGVFKEFCTDPFEKAWGKFVVGFKGNITPPPKDLVKRLWKGEKIEEDPEKQSELTYLGQKTIDELKNKWGLGEYKEGKVFIIDEINRGNISKIFGELITLIEESKRQGMEPEGASAILPYSKEEFSVPQNVYILGTMNTADRSIALIDTALRRRFDFIEMMPKESKLTDAIVEGINIEKMLKTINERIEALYDREHTIGHAFFMRLKDEPTPTLEMLASVFEKKIIPLLQEYFYDDYGKIQLVLGDNAKTDENYKFIKDETVDSSIFKGNTDISLPQKKYSINGEAFKKSEAYRQIYED